MVWEGAKHCSCIASIFLVTAQISSPLTDNGFERGNRPWETCLQSKLCRLLPKDPPLCHSQNCYLLEKNMPCHHLYFPERSKLWLWNLLFSKLEVEHCEKQWLVVISVSLYDSNKKIKKLKKCSVENKFLTNNLHFSLLLPGAFWKTDYKTAVWHG